MGIIRKAISMILVTALAGEASALTITIGRGSGIVWEGMPFSANFGGPFYSTEMAPSRATMVISNHSLSCISSTNLRSIGGYMAYPLGSSGVGLVPRARATAMYKRYDGTQESMNGTIGLPRTEATVVNGETTTTTQSEIWCLAPSMQMVQRYYDSLAPRNVTISGSWVLVADGTQQSSTLIIPPMFAGSYSMGINGDRSTRILPDMITLRISSLQCTVNTPTTIDFTTVPRELSPAVEMASITNPLNITCGQQSPDLIDANINLQFRALSGLYQSNSRRLSLAQGGGYITGEIGGVTGSGICNSNTGLLFDNTPVKMGEISNTATSTMLMNQVTWRLCSGGLDVPRGPVNASAEMLVTFN